MTEILVVTTLGLLALAVGAVSWTRVNASGRPRRRRSEPPIQSSDAVDGLAVFDAAADAGCSDAGGGADGGGGGCD